MNKEKLFLGFLLLGLISCGPSKEEQAAEEKRKIDSTVAATKEQMQAEQSKKDSIKLDNQKKAIQKKAENEKKEAIKDSIENRYIELKSELAMQQTKMRNIQEFHIGRTNDEKESQIYYQTKVIEKLNLEINEVRAKIKEN